MLIIEKSLVGFKNRFLYGFEFKRTDILRFCPFQNNNLLSDKKFSLILSRIDAALIRKEHWIPVLCPKVRRTVDFQFFEEGK